MVYMARQIPKGFDIINCHNAPTHWAGVFVKRKLDVPIVWSCNEPPHWYSDPIQRRGLGRISHPLYAGLDKTAVSCVDKIVANSSAGVKRIQKAYGRFSIAVNPGISTDLFRNSSGYRARIKVNLESDFVLLQVGNIAQDKRQIDSIMALYYLCKKYENVKLILVGQGPRDKLAKLSKSLGVEQKVLFLQDVSEQELADIYAACEVFIFPAQITWGLVVLEAMASSKPVVVAEETGVSELITDGMNGVIVKEPYAENMAAEVEKLMADANLRLRMGCNAYECVSGNLSWAVYAKKMEGVFRKVIQTYRAAN